MEKKLDEDYIRMLYNVWNKSRDQHPTKLQLLPVIWKTIQVRSTRHVGHCWRSKNKFIRDLLLESPKHGRTSVSQSVRTYFHQLNANTGCCLEELLGAMDASDRWRERERERERERVREIHAASMTRWW